MVWYLRKTNNKYGLASFYVDKPILYYAYFNGKLMSNNTKSINKKALILH